ncbi:hypothetical protein Acr_01g0000520 [Actinidia rufa]|uniref:Uncharacterized protein n=1 Tax=Actinidia rufa TaxID=165716 RepID=A0A7J0E158_9ERIC|nr:hypothetical protein Acr_01g0000480 [Actinidia rufa]GFY80243.1 hypothetical protein Acr_01g0000520 [Actinidia rufa]
MDELKDLEEAQRTIMSMQSRGLISSSYNDSDSNRFLANFTLLMLQPCGGLDMEKKCQLIHENLPKISAVFLEEAVPCVSEEGRGCEIFTRDCLLMIRKPSKAGHVGATVGVKHKASRFMVGTMRTLNHWAIQAGNCEQKKAGAGSMQSDYEDMAMVGLGAMQDANSTLEDFVSNTL